MNCCVTDSTVAITNCRLVVERRYARSKLLVDGTVTFHAQLLYRTAIEHLRIAAAVRAMAGGAAFGLERSVFESERPLLIRVTFDAR